MLPCPRLRLQEVKIAISYQTERTDTTYVRVMLLTVKFGHASELTNSPEYLSKLDLSGGFGVLNKHC